MAVDAVAAGVTKVLRIDMAGTALSRSMLAGQRESGFGVIEADARLPALWRVAGPAIFPQCIAVAIIGQVTVDTGGGGLIVATVVPVAALTACRGVTPE